MVKNSIITALLSAGLASGASAGTRDVQKHGQFFQNIKAEHVVPLLEGSAYVSHEDYHGLGKTRAGGDYLFLGMVMGSVIPVAVLGAEMPNIALVQVNIRA